MQEWLHEYKEQFLLTDHVRGELCSICNHGLYFDMQMISVMRFLGECAPSSTPNAATTDTQASRVGCDWMPGSRRHRCS